MGFTLPNRISLSNRPPNSALISTTFKAITAAVSNLTEHLSRVEYESHRKGGYPIGSGAIESAHRFVAQVRLKRSGAWWYEASSNHMLALRCAKYNGTLEAVFERHAHARQTQ